MLIHFIKFIHLLLTLGLLGSAIYCMKLVGSRPFATPNSSSREIVIRVNKIMLLVCLFAMVTGTFLVIPKHFTFHTPWIQAAYLLLLLVGVGIASLLTLKKKRLPKRENAILTRKERLAWQLAYALLILLLIIIIHDAVTKTTFLFGQ